MEAEVRQQIPTSAIILASRRLELKFGRAIKARGGKPGGFRSITILPMTLLSSFGAPPPYIAARSTLPVSPRSQALSVLSLMLMALGNYRAQLPFFQAKSLPRIQR